MVSIRKSVRVFFALALSVVVFAIVTSAPEASAREVARSRSVVRGGGFGVRSFGGHGGGVSASAFVGRGGHGANFNSFNFRSHHVPRQQVFIQRQVVPFAVPVQSFAVPVQSFGVQSFGFQSFADPCTVPGVGVSAFGFSGY